MGAAIGNTYALGNEGGAPTKYKTEYAEQAYKLCLLGFTDKELADFFEVSPDTIYEWKNVHPEFSEKVSAGKEMADADVADSFYKRARGYNYNEVTYEKIDSSDSMGVDKEGDIEAMKTDTFKKKVVTKHLPPDPGAALNWLKNRQKGKWRDKQEVDVRTPDGVTINYNLQKGNDPLDEG